MASESTAPDAHRDAATLRGRLEALIGQAQVSADYVRFRADLLTAQWQTYHAVPPSPAVADSAAPQAAHRPRLGPASVRFDPELLRPLLAAIAAAAARHGSGSRDATQLVAAADRDPTVLERVSASAAFDPDGEELGLLAGEVGASPEGLVFLGRTLAAPFVTRAAARWVAELPPTDVTDRGAEGQGAPEETASLPTSGGSAGASPSQVARSPTPGCAPGACPVCGSPPGLAELRRDDGQRVLHCSLCGTGWRFARLACPDCGVREPGALGFLRLGAEDPRWVETCTTCRGYIKTVDARKLPAGPPFAALVEDTATLHLDLLAEREGCGRRRPYAALW